MGEIFCYTGNQQIKIKKLQLGIQTKGQGFSVVPAPSTWGWGWRCASSLAAALAGHVTEAGSAAWRRTTAPDCQTVGQTNKQ